MADVEGDKLKLITLPLGPKHNARPTRRVNTEYANALWDRCNVDALRDVVRSINPDKFNMVSGTDTHESTVGRKRRTTQEPCELTLEQAQAAHIVSLQSDLETEKKEVKKLEKQLAQRNNKIATQSEDIAEYKRDIARLKKDLKKEQNKKPKSIPSKCTRCTTRAREETTPENNKTSKGGRVAQLTSEQQPQHAVENMVRVLVSERDKNDKLVLDLTAAMTNTLQKVVADVVQNK